MKELFLYLVEGEGNTINQVRNVPYIEHDECNYTSRSWELNSNVWLWNKHFFCIQQTLIRWTLCETELWFVGITCESICFALFHTNENKNYVILQNNTIQRRYLSCVFLRNLNPFTAEMYNTCSTHTNPPLPFLHRTHSLWLESFPFAL